MDILNTYEVQPVAYEISAFHGRNTLRFLNKVGHIAAECRDEPRERRWLMERVSIAMLRGNATAILSALLSSHCRYDMKRVIN